ncbi:Imm50 family immunity protein [Caballeronia sp. LZ008]|uniref:Imm50 family immunity protein n=1 Tax=unclassified Caballeronia TaxID=2646786 RepID=UPI002029080A|nr:MULTISPECIES: Imm50 family immunity protein [unclassified Caballeronia]MDR5795672.1 Imm50 family immunity protein [Caballeronia sp. LZ008]
MKLVELAGAELLRRVFSYSPTTEKIDLFDISLKRDGKVFVANFDLIDQIPDRPPEKWKNFNRCRVGIYCAVVSELQVLGWNARNISTLCITKVSDKYGVRITGESLEIKFLCQFISLTGPTVYLDEE